MNPVKIEVSTPMIDGSGRETVLTLSSDYDADYIRLLSIRRGLLEKCEKNGWKAANGVKTTVAQPAIETTRETPVVPPQTTNQQSADAPYCRHDVPAKLIRSTYKKGARVGEEYSAWACPKDKADSCGYFEFTKEFIPPNHQPMRDLDEENANDPMNRGDEDIPF